MAFKRVLSVVLLVVVLVSTLCGFAPIEVKNEFHDDITTVSVPPVVEFYFSFASDVGTLTLQWDNGYQVFTGGIGESDQVRKVSTITKNPIEYPLGMFKYNLIFDMGTYSASKYTIKIWDSIDDFPNGQLKALYSTESIFDEDSQTYESIDIFIDNDDYVAISSNNDIITSTTKNQFTANFYVNYSTLSKQYLNGFNVGFEEGLQIDGGYQQGFNEGRAEGISSGLIGMFTDPIGALFNFTIIPAGNNTPALTFGAVFLVLIAISLIVIYLKYFAGG